MSMIISNTGYTFPSGTIQTQAIVKTLFATTSGTINSSSAANNDITTLSWGTDYAAPISYPVDVSFNYWVTWGGSTSYYFAWADNNPYTSSTGAINTGSTNTVRHAVYHSANGGPNTIYWSRLYAA